MKYLITLIAIITLQSCGVSQTIINIADESFSGDTKNGQYYHKDVNNYFDKFLGTWKYEYDNNKEFRITINMVEMYHVNKSWANYYKDGLLISYQKYENGQLVYQSPMDDYPTGIPYSSNKLSMSFTDYGRYDAIFNLDITLEGEILIGEQEQKLRFELSNPFETTNYYFREHPNEPFYSVPNDILMTKVE